MSDPGPSLDTSTSLVIRWGRPSQRWGLAGALLGLGVFLGVYDVLSTHSEDHTMGASLTLLGALVGLALLAWRIAAWSLTANPEGLVVRNLIWTSRLPWSRIAAFDDDWTKDEGGLHWVLKIELEGGSTVQATATSGHPSEAQILGQLGRERGIRVNITPQ